MATSKATVVVFCMAALLVCRSLLVSAAEDGNRFISYGGMERDKVPKQVPGGYDAPPANEYNRGCEAINRCRPDAVKLKKH